MGPRADYAHESAQTMSEIQKEPFIDLAGGLIRCRRCQAKSKRSGEQCKKPAIRNKRVCTIHGGRSSGPKTEEGRQRIADARTVHGEETRAKREQRSRSSAKLLALEDIGWTLGMMTGTRTRGRKPKNYRPIKTVEEAWIWFLLDIASAPK
jgi:hypothetical protein